MNRSRALAYIRLSGRDESKLLSPAQQLAHCQQVIQRLGAQFDPATDIYDEGIGFHSARARTNLEQFDKMLARALTASDVKYIMSYDSARVFRELETSLHTLKQLSKKHIEWHSFVNGQLGLSDELWLKTIITGMQDEDESRRTTRRLLDHYAAVKREQGYAGHRPMFGLRRTGSEKNHTVRWETTDDFRIVQDVVRLYATGLYSAEAIAEILHKRGVRWVNQRGQRSLPYGNTIRKLLGRIEFYAPFLPDQSQVQRVIEIREARRESVGNHAPFKYPVVLLRGLVYCVCGRRFVQSYWTDRQGEKKPYYAHPSTPACDIAPRMVAAHKFETHVLAELRPVFDLTPEERAYVIERSLAQIARDLPATDNGTRLAELERQLAKLNLTFAQTEMTPLEYNVLRAELTAQHDELAGSQRVTIFLPTREYLESVYQEAYAFFEDARKYSPEGANALMERLIERVTVRGREIIEVKRRV